MESKVGDLEGLAQSSVKVLDREATAETTTKETVAETPTKTEHTPDSKPVDELKEETKAVEPNTVVEAKLAVNEPVAETTPSVIEPTSVAETKLSVNTMPETKPEAEAKPAAETKTVVDATDDVPDPDEDDLDDLDDMLDEFAPTQPSLPTVPKPTSLPTEEEDEEDGLSDEDFAKQLQAGMAELLGDMGSSPEMQAQFESMLKELGGEAEAEASSSIPGPSSAEPAAKDPAKKKKKKKSPKAAATAESGAAAEESFQETIRKTMERLNVSGDQATAAASSADPSDDLMAEMLKAMQAGGEGGEEDFSKMLLGMMEQLTNKEILYEPMKELDDKFPGWLEKNEGKVPKDDLGRYKDQQVFVKEIVDRFEKAGYSDENAADREYIVERMQKMQAAGSPPPDLVGDMAAAQEAFGGAPEEGCPQQ